MLSLCQNLVDGHWKLRCKSVMIHHSYVVKVPAALLPNYLASFARL